MSEAKQMQNMEQMSLWFELHQLQERYVHALDNDRLEQWPDFFTDDCLYEIVPRENADAGLPIGIIYCDSKKMLQDRVVKTEAGWRYARRRVVYDTLRVATLLATPI